MTVPGSCAQSSARTEPMSAARARDGDVGQRPAGAGAEPQENAGEHRARRIPGAALVC